LHWRFTNFLSLCRKQSKNDAKAFAAGNSDKARYLDSIGKENVFNLGFTNFNFDEVSDKQINKGLDLEGGINVILKFLSKIY
jgi:SecD/SecF fusion protein